MICREPHCTMVTTAGGSDRCAYHEMSLGVRPSSQSRPAQSFDDELAIYDRAELEALRDIHERSRTSQRRSALQTVAAASFAVAISAAAVAAGAGALGVVFVTGCAAGILCLFKASES